MLIASSIVRGGHGAYGGFSPPTAPGGAGVSISSPPGGPESWVWISDSVVVGGPGAERIFVFPVQGPGGPGIGVDSAHVRLSGDSASLVQGGPGSAGGTGILAFGTADVRVHGVPLLGGQSLSSPGPPTSGPGILLGLPALPILRLSGNLSLAGGPVTLTALNGPPDALFGMAISSEPAHFGIPGPFLGEFLLELPFTPFLFGSLSGTGGFSQTFPLGGLPPTLAYLPFHIQAGALDGNGVWRLSNSVAGILRP